MSVRFSLLPSEELMIGSFTGGMVNPCSLHKSPENILSKVETKNQQSFM